MQSAEAGRWGRQRVHQVACSFKFKLQVQVAPHMPGAHLGACRLQRRLCGRLLGSQPLQLPPQGGHVGLGHLQLAPDLGQPGMREEESKSREEGKIRVY